MNRLKFVGMGFLLGLFVFVVAIVGITISKMHETQAQIKEVPMEIKADKFKLAQSYRSEGDIEKAISTLKELIKEIENPGPELTLLGECYIDKKQYKLAEETLKKAIEITPESPYALRAYAALDIQLARYAEALEYINKALKFSSTPSDQAYGYAQLANLYGAQNKIDKAIESAQKAVDLFPEDVYFQSILIELEKKKLLEK